MKGGQELRIWQVLEERLLAKERLAAQSTIFLVPNFWGLCLGLAALGCFIAASLTQAERFFPVAVIFLVIFLLGMMQTHRNLEGLELQAIPCLWQEARPQPSPVDHQNHQPRLSPALPPDHDAFAVDGVQVTLANQGQSHHFALQISLEVFWEGFGIASSGDKRSGHLQRQTTLTTELDLLPRGETRSVSFPLEVFSAVGLPKARADGSRGYGLGPAQRGVLRARWVRIQSRFPLGFFCAWSLLPLQADDARAATQGNPAPDTKRDARVLADDQRKRAAALFSSSVIIAVIYPQLKGQLPLPRCGLQENPWVTNRQQPRGSQGEEGGGLGGGGLSPVEGAAAGHGEDQREGDFSGHRRYQPGRDSFRQVDWKAHARGRRWLVKEFQKSGTLSPQSVALRWQDLAQGQGLARQWPEGPEKDNGLGVSRQSFDGDDTETDTETDTDDEARLSQLTVWVQECWQQQKRFSLELPQPNSGTVRVLQGVGLAHYQRCLQALAGFSRG